MKQVGVKILANGKVNIHGMLTLPYVPQLLAKTDAIIHAQHEITLDLIGVERGDSAGLALLLYWLQQAKKVKHQLKVINMPKQLQKMATVCELNELI